MLALWNSFSDNQDEYDAWHTREHVLERLTVPGFVSVRRYRKSTGPLPDYLTLYWLSDAQVLESPEYLNLVENPSDWSLGMRDGLTDVIRHAYADAVHLGRGIGAEAAVKLVSYREELGDALSTFFETSKAAAITGLMTARLVPNLTELPFLASTRDPLPPDTAMLLLEGFDADALRSALALLDLWLASENVAGDWTTYRLAFLAGEEDAASPVRRTASLARAS